MADAPVFIPHTRPERGPLWFAEPRTALLGAIPDTCGARRRPRSRRGRAVRRPDDHRILHRRPTSEPCTSVALSASTPNCRNCSPTRWTATSWSSTRATCPPSAPPPCASKCWTGTSSRRRRPAGCDRDRNGGTPWPNAGSNTGRSGRASPGRPAEHPGRSARPESTAPLRRAALPQSAEPQQERPDVTTRRPRHPARPVDRD